MEIYIIAKLAVKKKTKVNEELIRKLFKKPLTSWLKENNLDEDTIEEISFQVFSGIIDSIISEVGHVSTATNAIGWLTSRHHSGPSTKVEAVATSQFGDMDTTLFISGDLSFGKNKKRLSTHKLMLHGNLRIRITQTGQES